MHYIYATFILNIKTWNYRLLTIYLVFSGQAAFEDGGSLSSSGEGLSALVIVLQLKDQEKYS